jgi:hypothetical protein
MSIYRNWQSAPDPVLPNTGPVGGAEQHRVGVGGEEDIGRGAAGWLVVRTGSVLVAFAAFCLAAAV